MNIAHSYITQESNHGKANQNKPKYIVIHDTGNTNPTADADNHASWLNSTPNTGRSAHIFVDDHQAIQIIPFTTPAWHTGKLYISKPKVPDCTNYNSIGIEFCINQDGNLTKTLSNTVNVVAQLMTQFKIPIENVITHQMAAGKECPGTFIKNPSLYNQFMQSLKQVTEEVDQEVANALAYLKKKGITNTPNYWLNKIKEVAYLRELILNMENALRQIEERK